MTHGKMILDFVLVQTLEDVEIFLKFVDQYFLDQLHEVKVLHSPYDPKVQVVSGFLPSITRNFCHFPFKATDRIPVRGLNVYKYSNKTEAKEHVSHFHMAVRRFAESRGWAVRQNISGNIVVHSHLEVYAPWSEVENALA